LGLVDDVAGFSDNAQGSFECKYRALLSVYRALLNVHRVLLSVFRALLRTLLLAAIVCHIMFSFVLSCWVMPCYVGHVDDVSMLYWAVSMM